MIFDDIKTLVGTIHELSLHLNSYPDSATPPSLPYGVHTSDGITIIPEITEITPP